MMNVHWEDSSMCQLISDGGLLDSGPFSGKRQMRTPRYGGRRTEQRTDD